MNELASRYAQALYSLKLESNKLLETQEEVKELKKVISDNPDFIVVLSSYQKSFEQKEEIIDQVFVGVDPDIITLMKIIVKNHRASYLNDVFECFNGLVNDYRGVLEGLVYSSIPLKEEDISKLNQVISEVEKRPTDLKNIVDPSLIGGVKVVINDHIYDGSIKSRIEKLKSTLLKQEGHI